MVYEGFALRRFSPLFAMEPSNARALINVWRRLPSFGRFSAVSNGGLLVAGALLFLMQMHGYLHATDPHLAGSAAHAHAATASPAEVKEAAADHVLGRHRSRRADQEHH